MGKHNIAEDDVSIIELAIPFQLHALKTGYVDALLTVEPIGTIARTDGIAKDLISSPMNKYISEPWYGGVGAITTSLLKNAPIAAKKILDIFEAAINEIHDNPNDCRRFLSHHITLEEEILSKIPIPFFKMYQKLDSKDIEALNKFFTLFEFKAKSKVNVQDLLISDAT